MATCKATKVSAVSQSILDQIEQGNFIRKAFEEGLAMKKQYGENKVFDLSLGNPIAEPPAEFIEELHKAIDSSQLGTHRYMVNAGYPDVRTEIAKYMTAETGKPFTLNEIIMSVGAGNGLNLALKALVSRDDEIVIFAPYFPEFLLYVQTHSGVEKIVPTDENFLPDMAALEKALSPRTKVVIINSPNNPTGVVYYEDTLKKLGEVIREKENEYGTQIFILSDEPYRQLNYNGRKPPYVFNYHPRSISVTSHSKDLSLAGERIGYVAVNPDCDEDGELGMAVGFCHRALGTVNAPALMQRVVGKLQGVHTDLDDYKKKRDYMYNNLTDMGYEIVKPKGAFYMFPKSPVDDLEFADELRKHMVLVVPGVAFGTPGYFRIAYCVEDRVLEGSLRGFKEVAKKYGMI